MRSSLELTTTDSEASVQSSYASPVRPRRSSSQRPKLPLLLPKPPSPPPPAPPRRKTGQRRLFSSTVRRDSVRSVRNRHSGCFVPICFNPHCRLRSHHEWDPGTAPSYESGNDDSRGLSDSSSTEFSLSVLGRGVDGIPNLPVDDLDQQQLRTYFHLYYTRLYPRIMALVLPPALTDAERVRLANRRDESVRVALSDGAFCMNVTSSAYLSTLTVEAYKKPDKFFAQLRGKTLELLRAKLGSFKLKDVDSLVLIIWTVVQFDLMLGNWKFFNDHRKGLSHLVTSRGGVHNLGRSSPMVFNLDRSIAIVSGQKPLFAAWVDRSLLKQPTSASIYGTALDTRLSASEVESDVTEFCHDGCCAIEILEGENWAYNLGDDIPDFNVSRIHYFYFLKNVVMDRFAHLQAWDFSATPKSRTVLFASNLVQYISLQDGYSIPLIIFMADHLKENLELRDIRKEWVGMEDVLRWVLCVLLCLPHQWSGHGWTVLTYTKTLDIFYADAAWPPQWVSIEKHNCRRFVWSDARFDAQLSVALGAIERKRLTKRYGEREFG